MYSGVLIVRPYADRENSEPKELLIDFDPTSENYGMIWWHNEEGEIVPAITKSSTEFVEFVQNTLTIGNSAPTETYDSSMWYNTNETDTTAGYNVWIKGWSKADNGFRILMPRTIAENVWIDYGTDDKMKLSDYINSLKSKLDYVGGKMPWDIFSYANLRTSTTLYNEDGSSINPAGHNNVEVANGEVDYGTDKAVFIKDDMNGIKLGDNQVNAKDTLFFYENRTMVTADKTFYIKGKISPKANYPVVLSSGKSYDTAKFTVELQTKTGENEITSEVRGALTFNGSGSLVASYFETIEGVEITAIMNSPSVIGAHTVLGGYAGRNMDLVSEYLEISRPITSKEKLIQLVQSDIDLFETAQTERAPSSIPKYDANGNINGVMMTEYVDRDFYDTSGTGSAIILTPRAGTKQRTAYTAGMRVIFKATADSGIGTVTVNVNELGVQNVINSDQEKTFRANYVYSLIHDGTNFQIESFGELNLFRQLGMSYGCTATKEDITGGERFVLTQNIGKIESYYPGMLFSFVAPASSTGPGTIKLNGKTEVDFLQANGDPLGIDSVTAGNIVTVGYDGTAFRLAGGSGSGDASFRVRVYLEAHGLTQLTAMTFKEDTQVWTIADLSTEDFCEGLGVPVDANYVDVYTGGYVELSKLGTIKDEDDNGLANGYTYNMSQDNPGKFLKDNYETGWEQPIFKVENDRMWICCKIDMPILLDDGSVDQLLPDRVLATNEHGIIVKSDKYSKTTEIQSMIDAKEIEIQTMHDNDVTDLKELINKVLAGADFDIPYMQEVDAIVNGNPYRDSLSEITYVANVDSTQSVGYWSTPNGDFDDLDTLNNNLLIKQILKEKFEEVVLFEGTSQATGVITLTDNWDNYNWIIVCGHDTTYRNERHICIKTSCVNPSDETIPHQVGEISIYNFAGSSSGDYTEAYFRVTNKNELYVSERSGGSTITKIIGIGKIN